MFWAWHFRLSRRQILPKSRPWWSNTRKWYRSWWQWAHFFLHLPQPPHTLRFPSIQSSSRSIQTGRRWYFPRWLTADCSSWGFGWFYGRKTSMTTSLCIPTLSALIWIRLLSLVHLRFTCAGLTPGGMVKTGTSCRSSFWRIHTESRTWNCCTRRLSVGRVQTVSIDP